MDKYDDHPSIYYTGNIYRCFRNFKRGNKSDHGKGDNQFNNILEHEVKTVIYQVVKVVFSNV